jgi:hypothetical protein
MVFAADEYSKKASVSRNVLPRRRSGVREEDVVKTKLFVLLCALVAAHLSVALVIAQKGKGKSVQVPASATFDDALDDKITSDELGTYDPDVGCVISWVDTSSGQYFFRTATRSCHRFVSLDFTDAVVRNTGCEVQSAFGHGTLNICGTNAIPDARFLVDKLFNDSALSTGTHASVRFSLAPDFQNTDFELDFEQTLDVDGDSMTRTMIASSDTIAELYRFTGKGANKVSLGRFRMPFGMTVTKNP